MTRLTAACVLLVAAGVWAAPRPKDKPTNLVANGSFEDGPEVNVYVALDPGSTAIKGWTVTRGQIDLCHLAPDDTWKAAVGKRSLDLHGSPGFGGVKQEIATRAGKKYRVTFQMTTNMNQVDEVVKLAVRAAGDMKEFELKSAGRTHDDPKWEKMSWDFTATADMTELEIHTAMPPTAFPFGGPMLDDVSVVAVE